MASIFTTPTQMIVGENSLEAAAIHLKKLGKKALIITGKTVVTLPCFKELTKTLKGQGIMYEVFSGITGEPTDKMVEEGLACFKACGADFMIGIGGGSPLDAMKAMALLESNGGKITDYRGHIVIENKVPLVAIPTTAGTGSEATQFTVITDSKEGIKMLLKGECLIPKLAIVDPAFSVSSPQHITCSTGLDALTHAIEAYTSRKAQALSDVMCLSAIKRIFKYLPIAYHEGNQIEARAEMALAALEAGIAINNSTTTLVHGMSRPIGAQFHVPHGLSNAMLLTVCLPFIKEGVVDKFANMARAIGLEHETDEQLADAFLDKVQELCEICEVPTLQKYGIDQQIFLSKIDKMAADAIASGSPATTVREVTKEHIVAMYHRVYNGNK